MVGGSRGNVRALLENGELLMIFPEGTPGIIKPFSKRYQLQKFRVGHAELAVRNQVPIIPVGIIGAEEQLPSVFSSRRLGKMFGIEAVPIPILPLPLPVRYRIFYGKPITSHLSLDPSNADDPDILRFGEEGSERSIELIGRDFVSVWYFHKQIVYIRMVGKRFSTISYTVQSRIILIYCLGKEFLIMSIDSGNMWGDELIFWLRVLHPLWVRW